MAQFTNALINEFKESSKKSSFFKKTWSTDDKDTMTLEEYSNLVDPRFKCINMDENPVVIAKEKKNGKIFYKLLIFLQGDNEVEYDLSYEADTDDICEGDEFDSSSLKFCLERWMGESHLYVTGELV